MSLKSHRPGVVRVAAGLIAASLALALSACAPGDAQSGGSPAAGQTTITYLSWENEERGMPLIAAFEAANPDIKVEFQHSPPVAEYIQTLQTRIAGNQAPDVFRINPETKAQLIGEGHVADLSDLGIVDKLGEGNRRAYTKDGKLYGVSFGAWEAGIFYNKDLLAKVGATEVPATWDEFLELSKKLKDAGITPYLESLAELPRIFQAFMGAKYDEAGIPEGEGVIFSGGSTFAQEWPASLAQWKRIYDEGIIGVEAISLSNDQPREEFVAGNCAMYLTGGWDLTAVEESGVNYGVALTPGLNPDNRWGAGAPEPGFAISSKIDGDKLAASKRLLEWLGSPEGLQAQAEGLGTLITAQGFDSEVLPTYREVYESGLKRSRYYLSMEYWEKGGDALMLEGIALIHQMIQGSLTPEQVAAGMDAKLATLG